jgi:hypothetical protein
MSRFDPTDLSGLLERYRKPTLLGWQGAHTQTSNGKECDAIGIARGDSAQVLAKRRNEPIALPSIQLAQLCDILADGIKVQLRADAPHSSN